LDFERATCSKPATDLEFHAWLHYTDALAARHQTLPANYTYATVLRHFLHGIRAANIWVWSRHATAPAGAASFASSPTIPLESVEELLRAALDVRRLTAEIIALSRAPQRVAILRSDAACLQVAPALARSQVLSPMNMELDNVTHGTLFLDTPIGYVTERSIADGALRDYRVVLVPAVDHLDEGTLHALLKYVEEGGHLVVTPRSFVYDEYHHPREQNDLPKTVGVSVVGLLNEPTPAQLADPDFLERATVDPGDPRTPTVGLLSTGQPPFDRAGIPLAGAGVRLHFADAQGEPLARFADDRSPAIVRVERGQGHIDCCAIPLRPQSYAQLVEAVIREEGIERPVRLRASDGSAQPVWGVEARSCRDGDDLLVYAINLLAEPIAFDLVTEEPILAVHDCLANQPASTHVRRRGLGVALLRLKTGSGK